MKLKVYLLLGVLVFILGRAEAAFFSEENEALRAEAISVQYSILELLDYRTFAVKAVKELNAQAVAKIPLRGDQLEPFHQNVVARSQIKTALLKQIEPYLDLVNHPERIKTDTELFHYLMTMAVGYTLTDNYREFVEMIQNNDHLRHIANEENSGFNKSKNLLKETVRQFYSVKFHRPTLRGARRFDELGFNLDQEVLKDPDLAFFWTIIETSGTFNDLRNQNDFQKVTYDIGFFFKKLVKAKKVFRDLAYYSLEATVYGVSKLFGNTAGRFQSRNGYLYRNTALETHFISKLQPGDILLEKTPFRLTDRFIPGYWGHNAIWLGTEEQLKALGVWDHPKVRPLHKKIKEGRNILEALRPGVTMNSMAHFMDIDSLAILRRPNMNAEEMRNVVIRVASQYGKPFDFGFDVETQDTLVCSELMFMTFTDVPFRLEKKLGRYTINPDSVAELGVSGTFDIVTLIASGRAPQGDLRKAMAELLHKEEK